MNNIINEIIGWAGIIFGLMASIFQVLFLNKSQNTESFPFEFILFSILGQLLFTIQGIFKKSATISISRLITTLYFCYIMYVYISNIIKNNYIFSDVVKKSLLTSFNGLKQIIINIINFFKNLINKKKNKKKINKCNIY